MPKVSIILPTYNGEKYLKESIDSILNQTFTDFELIIVDDCSIDSTPEIIEEYLKKDKRIKIIRNKANKKLPESLNVGFREAKGEYLTWTSDDNLYLSDAISTMVEFLEENQDVYLVCGDMKLIDDEGMIIGEANKYDNDRIYINDDVGACFLYRNMVLKDIGEYDSSMVFVEDYDYWIRVFNKYGYIHRIPKVLYYYRWHNNSLTFSKAKEIRNQLNNLREKYKIWDYFIEIKKEIPIELYYDYLLYKGENIEILQKNWNRYPELKIEYENVKNNALNKKIILFGSGSKGREANKILGDRVKFFVDNNINKVGKILDGKEIISFDALLKIYNNYDIIVAVNSIMALEIMKQLSENGIKNFISWNIYEIILEERKI